jgi:hypothetical protein
MLPDKLSRPWLTLGIRLTVFPVTPQEAPADLWEQVVGLAPDADQYQPRQHLRVQTGPWREGVLQLTVSPDRFVWLAGPSPTSEGLLHFENWPVETMLPAFVDDTRPWLTSMDFGIKRIGFGLHSVLSAQDRASAYRLLEELVPSVRLVEPEAAIDLLFQINRPVSSRVLGDRMRLNRLMKWSALFLGHAQIQVTPEVAQTGPVIGSHFASLDNDTNTPAEHLLPFDKTQLGAIYDEIVELSWENLELGEMT